MGGDTRIITFTFFWRHLSSAWHIVLHLKLRFSQVFLRFAASWSDYVSELLPPLHATARFILKSKYNYSASKTSLFVYIYQREPRRWRVFLCNVYGDMSRESRLSYLRDEPE